jgi:hypothetical protein
MKTIRPKTSKQLRRIPLNRLLFFNNPQNYQQSNTWDMMGATSEAEMVYPSVTPKYTPVFSEDCV